jgi:hypothetical protein
MAQEGSTNRKTDVVISVISDSAANWLSQGRGNASSTTTPFWILRFRDGKQRNVIALRESTASAALLLDAIQRFHALPRITRWLPKSRVIVTTVEGKANGVADAGTNALYANLRAAPPVAVRYIGTFPAVTMRIPVVDPDASANASP